MNPFERSRTYFLTRAGVLLLFLLVPSGLVITDGKTERSVVTQLLVVLLVTYSFLGILDYQTYRTAFSPQGIHLPWRRLFPWQDLKSSGIVQGDTYVFKFRGAGVFNEVRVALKQFKAPELASRQLKAWIREQTKLLDE